MPENSLFYHSFYEKCGLNGGRPNGCYRILGWSPLPVGKHCFLNMSRQSPPLRRLLPSPLPVGKHCFLNTTLQTSFSINSSVSIACRQTLLPKRRKCAFPSESGQTATPLPVGKHCFLNGMGNHGQVVLVGVSIACRQTLLPKQYRNTDKRQGCSPCLHCLSANTAS